MKYLILIIVFLGFITTPAFAQEVNPSLTIENMEILAEKFNTVLKFSAEISKFSIVKDGLTSSWANAGDIKNPRNKIIGIISVSYTHLTLPTILLV